MHHTLHLVTIRPLWLRFFESDSPLDVVTAVSGLDSRGAVSARLQEMLASGDLLGAQVRGTLTLSKISRSQDLIA
eukprot:2618099-Rhodomonas_salina.2